MPAEHWTKKQQGLFGLIMSGKKPRNKKLRKHVEKSHLTPTKAHDLMAGTYGAEEQLESLKKRGKK